MWQITRGLIFGLFLLSFQTNRCTVEERLDRHLFRWAPHPFESWEALRRIERLVLEPL
jgi:hypothetical protein